MGAKQQKVESGKVGIVPEWYFMAFHMRLMGISCAKIAIQLGKNKDVVARIFRTGKLKDLWEDYKNQQMKKCVEESMTILISHLPETTMALVLEAKKSGMSGNVARKLHLDAVKIGEQDTKDPTTILDVMTLLHDADDELKRQEKIEREVAAESVPLDEENVGRGSAIVEQAE